MFIKLAIVGQSQGQEVVSVLYYAEADGQTTLALDPAIRTAVGETFITAQLDNYLSQVWAGFTTQEVQVSAVDENNTVVSNYTVFLSDNTPGGRAGDTDGVSQVGIIGFQLSYPFTGAPVGLRVPKRSYLAYGPIVSADIANNGGMLWDSTAMANIQLALLSSIVLASSEWHPVRIGVPNEGGVSAAGWVEGVIFRPFTSDRRSRRQRPNGR